MYKSITLPDNISFEELAERWCDYRDGFAWTALEYYSGKWEFVQFVENKRYSYFIFDHKSRELKNSNLWGVDDHEELILDFIKERSNG